MHIRFIRNVLFAVIMLSMTAASFAQIGISISFAPPELPVYEQPLCPGDGYLWTPGYWAYANDYDDYYWVPGTWVMAPEIGFLWTPAYWGWGGNGYVFYEGYWGPQVGFYGGISYGYGYYGEGYQGGRWDNGHFFYNRSVNNVNVTIIHNVYNTTVINSTTVNRVSYNGGNGGISARPRPEDEAAAREKHIPAVAVQTQHAQAARSNPEQRASVNHGKPAVAATPKPGAFSDRAVVPAKAAGAPYNPPVKNAAVRPAANTPVAHPENNVARPVQPNTRPEPNRPEVNRPPTVQPATPAETPRPPTAQPNNRMESNRPPIAQPEPRPEPNRNEPAQRPQTPPPSERAQAQRASPPAEARPAPQQQQRPQQPAARAPEEKKPPNEQPKRDEKPPQ
jgi:WXXGXW repeat (2 copies)